METSEEIIDINDDFQESNEEGNYYINNSSNIINHNNEEEYDYSIPSNINKIQNGISSQKESQINEYELYNDYNYYYINHNNYSKNSNIDNDNDVDPNFADKKLKEEEEIRRRKEIEEFEQRTSPENQNIIDFDEIDNKDDENDIDEEGIIIDNSNYLTKMNSNNISIKYKEKQNEKNIIFNQNKIKNNRNYEIESEDIESKVTQIKNNRNNSYDKDDIISNKNKISKQKINEDIIIDKKNSDEQEIRNIYSNDSNKNKNYYNINNKKEIMDSKISNDFSQSKDYNMNFYDTSLIVNESNKKAKNKTSGVFQNLLPNKSFKKFLKTKIKYYMNENDIPKDFINNLQLDENNKNNKSIKYKTKTKSKSNTPNPKKYVQRIKTNDNEIKFNSNYKTIDNLNSNYDNEIESLNYKTRPKIQKRNTNNTYYKSMKNFYRNNIRYDNNINLVFDKNNNNYYQNEESDEKYISNYDKVFIENKINKEKIENLQKELNNQKNVMNEKLYKINMLENMNDNLKNEMNKLQQNFEYERINNKETKRNYDMIKNNYTDMKNQYDLLNLKYITLNDENFNYRRDKDLYEKQIKTKNEMIENLLENNSANKKKDMNNKLIEINYKTKSSNEIVSDYIKNKNQNNKNIGNKPEKNAKEEKNSKNENDKKVVDYHKYDNLTFPELQCKRDELLNERRDTNNIYCKIPLKSTSKEQINKRTMLENKIKEINCDLMIVKLRLKNFQNKK